MKVIVMSKTTLDVKQYDNVSDIAKSGTSITITYNTSSTATYSTNTHSIYIMVS